MTPDELKAARLALGLSQKELAKATGLGRRSIVRYESNAYFANQVAHWKAKGFTQSASEIKAGPPAHLIAFMMENENDTD